MRRQGIYKSGPGMVGQARRQIANMNQPAACVTNGTLYKPEWTEAVMEEDGVYFVLSPKYEHRYYACRQVEGRWLTSSKEEKFIPQLIAKVEAFISEQNELAEAA